ncbi:MAG: hypothetical protein AXA67_10445 [Methylothermaceae bacteria B42]|nr:MAG: hypothetical protein AXA67_10445 [Methylothermaceae bacteria B42]HHJ40512.1 PAS domain-containing sensor histidine kinase [Methylothermaceae bacterium]
MFKSRSSPPGIESLPRYIYTLVFLGLALVGLFLALMYQQWRAVNQQEKILSLYHLPSISVLYQLQHELDSFRFIYLQASQILPGLTELPISSTGVTSHPNTKMIGLLLDKIRELRQQFEWPQSDPAFFQLEQRLRPLLDQQAASHSPALLEQLTQAHLAAEQLRHMHDHTVHTLTRELDQTYAQLFWRLFFVGLLMLLLWGGFMVKTFAVVRKAIAQQKSTEGKIKEHEALLQNILDTIPVRVFWKDKDSKYLGCNALFAKDAGLDSPEEMVGKLDSQMAWAPQAELYRQDDIRVMETQKPKLAYEEPLTARDGSLRTLETSKVPLYNQAGEVIGVLGVYTDITQRKLQEEALHRSQKMEAVGQLAGGIAHDFNNQLNVVLGYLDFLNEYLQQDTTARPWLTKIEQSTEKCIQLTRRLLDFARGGSGELEKVDLNALIFDLSELLQRSLTPNIDFQLQLAEALWPVHIDKSRAEDALLNIVLNARDAMPDGGRLIIETYNYTLLPASEEMHPQLSAGDYVVISIRDTGIGMSEEVRRKIFTPFFTTKEMGKGSGLGLTMVYGFIRQCGGDIQVISQPGNGAEFRLYFPRAEQIAEPETCLSSKVDSNQTVPAGTGTILVVDDEPELLTLAVTHLQSLGYQTLEANNGVQALTMLKTHAEIDLLFSDIVMPGGINGLQLAQQAAQLRPEIKILLTSGHAGNTMSLNKIKYIDAKLLPKPYTKLELGLNIAALLKGKP